MTRIGLDIGGTKTCAAVVAADGTVLVSRTAPTPATVGPSAILDVGAALVRETAAEAGVRADRLGVGTAGVVDPGSGIIASATSALRDWAGTDVRSGLGERLGGADVRVVNDVHAFALGEAAHGAGRAAGSVLAVAVGTGVGGGFVVRAGSPAHPSGPAPAGRPGTELAQRVTESARGPATLLTGEHFVAGHIGHLTVPAAVGLPCPCGATAHLETVASGPAVVERFVAAGGRARNGHDVAAALAAGDLRAAAVVRTAGESLGIALAAAAALLDPAIVVVGGGALGLGDLFLATAREAFREYCLPVLSSVDIVAAELELPVAVGAATLSVEGER